MVRCGSRPRNGLARNQMILLNEITIKNFLSHEDTYIAFKENEKVLVDGKSGSGKSSIVEALVWCLYGEGRSEGRSLVRRGSKLATVSLKLDTGESQYVITRSVTDKGKNTLAITHKKGSGKNFIAIERTGIKDSQDWIEKELLKASYELFTNSVAYQQENENSFVKANAARRKDLLLEIVRAENFDELYDKARKALTANETDSTVLLSKIEGFKKTISFLAETAERVDLYQQEVWGYTQQIITLQKDEKALDSQISSVASLKKLLEEKLTLEKRILDYISTRETQAKSNEAHIRASQEIDIEKARAEVKEAEELSKTLEYVDKQLQINAAAQMSMNRLLADKPAVRDYSTDIDTINRKLIDLIRDTDKCPSGDKCPFVIPIQGQIQFLTEQIAEKELKSRQEREAFDKWSDEFSKLTLTVDNDILYKRKQEITAQMVVLNKSQPLVAAHETRMESNKILEEQNVQLKEANLKDLHQIVILTEEKVSIEKDLVEFDINKINLELSTARIELADLGKRKDESIANHATATQAKESVAEARTSLVELTSSTKGLIENKEALEAIKEALSPRGVKTVVIDYLVPQLEDKINEILGQMSDFRIHLDTQKVTADEEGMKEGLFISVINDLGEELPFQSYSGGEKVKTTIAISEALASLMVDIGFRIMDENIVSLDSDSTESFIKILAAMQEKFAQLIVISHLPEVKDIFENKIQINKINGISKITN